MQKGGEFYTVFVGLGAGDMDIQGKRGVVRVDNDKIGLLILPEVLGITYSNLLSITSSCIESLDSCLCVLITHPESHMCR